MLQAKAAVEAGKDVYCEKPLSNTIEEGRALVTAVQQAQGDLPARHPAPLADRHPHGLLAGPQRGTSATSSRSPIGSPPGLATGDHAPEPVPDWLDWDLFQGPAPERPYTPWRWARFKEIGNLASWYFISDYSKAGWIAGYGVHDIDLALWGLGITDEGPVTIEGKGVFPESGLFDTVLTYELHFTWPDGRRSP